MIQLNSVWLLNAKLFCTKRKRCKQKRQNITLYNSDGWNGFDSNALSANLRAHTYTDIYITHIHAHYMPVLNRTPLLLSLLECLCRLSLHCCNTKANTHEMCCNWQFGQSIYTYFQYIQTHRSILKNLCTHNNKRMCGKWES